MCHVTCVLFVMCCALCVSCVACEFSPNDSATVIINHTAKNAQFLRDWERYRCSLLCQPSC
jgi:hypothetical protein